MTQLTDRQQAIAKRAAAAQDRLDTLNKIERLARSGRVQRLLVAAGCPLVRIGGTSHLGGLREDAYDHARNTNLRATAHCEDGGLTGIESAYATALMGGEPYAIWY
jgi:hypothetical protein